MPSPSTLFLRYRGTPHDAAATGTSFPSERRARVCDVKARPARTSVAAGPKRGLVLLLELSREAAAERRDSRSSLRAEASSSRSSRRRSSGRRASSRSTRSAACAASPRLARSREPMQHLQLLNASGLAGKNEEDASQRERARFRGVRALYLSSSASSRSSAAAPLALDVALPASTGARSRRPLPHPLRNLANLADDDVDLAAVALALDGVAAVRDPDVLGRAANVDRAELRAGGGRRASVLRPSRIEEAGRERGNEDAPLVSRPPSGRRCGSRTARRRPSLLLRRRTQRARTRGCT